MNIPKKVLAKTAELKRRRRERREAEHRAARDEANRLRRLAEIREAHAVPSQTCVTFLIAWRLGLLSDPGSKRLFEAVGPKGGLTVFIGKFWRGEPCPPGDRTTWAKLELLADNRHYSYSEWHKGHESYRSRPLVTRDDLFNELHPDFLQQMVSHLNGPDAWKYVLNDLDRFG